MIAIIDYGMGNLASVYKALIYIGQKAVITNDPAVVKVADAVILPGVGAISTAMNNLEKSGMKDEIYEVVKRNQPLLGICLGMQMLFETSEEGSCEGNTETLPECGDEASSENFYKSKLEDYSKLIADNSSRTSSKICSDSRDEGSSELKTEGQTEPKLVKGLGILSGKVTLMKPYPEIKIPHMGWNHLIDTKGDFFKEGDAVYFVHSYKVEPTDDLISTSRAFHGESFVASVEQGKICAMQFHPEKSGEVGLEILKKWVKSFSI